MRLTIGCCVMLALPAFAGGPQLAGTWKGTAEKKVCGQSAGSEKIILTLRDPGNKATDGTFSINGGLTVGSAREGNVELLFDAAWSRLQSSRVRQDRPGPVSILHPHGYDDLSSYSVLLREGDAQGSAGDRQALSGTLSRRNDGCTQMGTGGEVLTVTLKKQ